MGSTGRKGHRGVRKYGRNKVKSERYKQEKRREKNKVRKINRHLKFHVNDWASKKRVEELTIFLEG